MDVQRGGVLRCRSLLSLFQEGTLHRASHFVGTERDTLDECCIGESFVWLVVRCGSDSRLTLLPVRRDTFLVTGGICPRACQCQAKAVSAAVSVASAGSFSGSPALGRLGVCRYSPEWWAG